jgi:hypothetical protein
MRDVAHAQLAVEPPVPDTASACRQRGHRIAVDVPLDVAHGALVREAERTASLPRGTVTTNPLSQPLRPRGVTPLVAIRGEAHCWARPSAPGRLHVPGIASAQVWRVSSE